MFLLKGFTLHRAVKVYESVPFFLQPFSKSFRQYFLTFGYSFDFWIFGYKLWFQDSWHSIASFYAASFIELSWYLFSVFSLSLFFQDSWQLFFFEQQNIFTHNIPNEQHYRCVLCDSFSICKFNIFHWTFFIILSPPYHTFNLQTQKTNIIQHLKEKLSSGIIFAPI